MLSFYKIFLTSNQANSELNPYLTELMPHKRTLFASWERRDFASRERRAPSYSLKTCDSDHMILIYELELVNHLRKHAGNEVTFKFYRGRGRHRVSQNRPVELKSCGVYLHFDENLPADTDLP